MILAGRVWRGLNAGLGWNSVVAAQTWRRPMRYKAYCEAMMRWSDGLQADEQVSPEDLEFALFHAGGRLEILDEL